MATEILDTNDIEALATATDRALLRRFAAGADELAFSELVRRHQSLVLHVCQRVLRASDAAEDACQATFLVLARRAGAMGWRDSIAGWLYQTAFRTASKMRVSLARRARLEREAAEAASNSQASNENSVEQQATIRDVGLVLDEELNRLPERFRSAVVLCHLEGLTRDEAAARLGCSVGAIKDRLERGRELLKSRLVRRGVTLSAAMLGSWLLASPVQAASLATADALVKSSIAFATGNLAAGTVSASALTLAKGMLNMMLLDKIKTAVVCLASFLMLGTIGYAMLVDVPDRFDRGLRGEVLAIDVTSAKPSITVMLENFETTLTLDISPDAKVAIAFQEAKLTDLSKEMYVSLRLAADHRTVNEVHARGTIHEGKIKSVSPDGKRISVAIDDDDEETVDSPKELDFATDAVLRIGGLPATREQLIEGLETSLELSKDGKTVNAVNGDVDESRVIYGRVSSVDLNGKAVKVVAEREDMEVESWLQFGAEKTTIIDGKKAAVADLKPGAHVDIRLSENKMVIEALVATNPSPEEMQEQAEEAAAEAEEPPVEDAGS